MNRKGHAGRTDGNHTAVVKALLDAGCSVQSLGVVGLGCPDLVVGLAGVNILLEVKNEDSPPNKRKLSDPEVKWQSRWKGQVVLVESPAAALRAVRQVLIEVGSPSQAHACTNSDK